MTTVLITGGGGMLARALIDEWRAAGATVHAPARAELDVTSVDVVNAAFARLKPQFVVQCAAFTRVDDAESNESEAFRINAEGAANVARACREHGARFIYPSTDYVFDGSASAPYPVDAPTNPINAYGRSKLAGEEAAREAGDFLVVRTSWLYGPGGRNFVDTLGMRLQRGDVLRVVNDQRGAPTWTRDLAAMIVRLSQAAPSPGIYHATNAGECTWYDLACEIARYFNRSGNVQPCSSLEFPTPARRPLYSVLDLRATERLIGPPRPWNAALEEALPFAG